MSHLKLWQKRDNWQFSWCFPTFCRNSSPHLSSMIKPWLIAFRLRTLPLATASILLGCGLAALHGLHHWPISILAVLTAVFLQILSNLANDFGDFENGADLAGRVGPDRMVATGSISPLAMKKAMGVFGALSFFTGVALLWVAFGGLSLAFYTLLLLGMAAIAAAVKYTAGRNPYGYAGLGDISVLLFFGLIAVLGTYYLHTQQLQADLLLPALGMGLLSVAVLNLNNMRDRESDARAGKRTIPVRFGAQAAVRYHTLLVLTALLALLYYARGQSLQLHLGWVVAGIWLLLNLYKIRKVKVPADYDPFLKRTALNTLLFALLLLLVNVMS
jgi:1,4-dihydroxy-2-naphthoate octaprenyltransferase